MKKVVAAGHICLDITPVFPPDRDYSDLGKLFAPGKLIRTGAADVHTGGSVANTGLAMKLLGADVLLLGKVGRDGFGSIIKQITEKYGVSGLITDENCSTSYSVVLAVPGTDRIFLHNSGANDTFCSEDIPDSSLEGAELFHFGYPPVMRKMYENGGAGLHEIFRRVKEKGILTSLDMAVVDPDSDAGKADWNEILEKVLPYVDFFVPSFEEICFMTDRGLYDSLTASGGDITDKIDLNEHVRPIARRLAELGAKTVLVKCGTKGMYYLSETEEGIQSCFKASCVVSATGAGDASIAAFLMSALNGNSVRESASYAAAEGACCVTAYDALSGLRDFEELGKIIAGKNYL